jgi:hypothetical protein
MLSVLDDLRQMRAGDVVAGVAGSMRSVAFGKIEAKMSCRSPRVNLATMAPRLPADTRA